jgi:hypothetical protein
MRMKNRSAHDTAIRGLIFTSGILIALGLKFGKETVITVAMIFMAVAAIMSWRRLAWYRIVWRSRKIAKQREYKPPLEFDKDSRNGH